MSKFFEASALQKAYHLGQSSDFILGGRSAAVSFCINIDAFDKERFETAVNKVISRHTLLHSFYDGEKWEENPQCEIIPEYISAEEDIAKAASDTQEEMMSPERGFDTYPLIRIKVLLQNNGSACAVFLFSGLILDGMSTELFTKELYAHYHGIAVKNAADIREHIAAEKEYLSSQQAAEDREFYRSIFASEELAEIQLPYKTQVENVQGAHSRVLYADFGEELYSGIKKSSTEIGVTPFVFMMTVFAYTISRYSDNDRFLLNLPCSVRSRAIGGIENTIGLCSNFMLFPVSLNRENTVRDNIINAQMQLLDMQEHMYYPGSEAVKDAREITGMNLAAPIVFTDMLGFSENSEGFCAESRRTHTNQVILEADLLRQKNRPVLALNYVTELLDEYTVKGIADTFMEALISLCSDKSSQDKNDISLSARDKEIIKIFNSTDAPKPENSLADIIREGFEKYSDRKAIVSDGEVMTYRQLEEHAAALCSYLTEKLGLKTGFKAAVLLPKCAEQVIAATGVILSGGAYMPVDIEMPSQQLKRLMDNVRPDIILTDKQGKALLKKIGYENSVDMCSLPASDKKTIIPKFEKPGDDTSIIINTSGSTGLPKSIMLKDSSIVGCLSDTVGVFGIEDGSRILSVTNFAHDMAIFDTLGIFFFGGCCVIPEAKKAKEPSHWLDLIKANNINLWNSVPAIMEMLILHMKSEKTSYGEIKRIILGGEFLRPTLAESIKNVFTSAELFNVGGPTETTVWNICHRVTDRDIADEIIPYGKPFPNTRYYVLNSRKEICPVGVKGTMFVTGSGVSKGYIGNDDETSRKFIKLFGCIAYNTGDIGFMLPSGELCICGRADDQIKLNGKRIELSAIESVICEAEDIISAAAVYLPEHKRLAAFFTAKTQISIHELRSFISDRTAEYMVPKSLFQLEEIPVTRNGKPDRKKLMEMTKENLGTVKNDTASGSCKDIRSTLMQLIIEELDDDSIDESMNFYMAGGDSLAAVKLSAKTGSMYGVKVSVYDIIDSPDISSWLEEVCAKVMNKNN